jgi:hypothetical protein
LTVTRTGPDFAALPTGGGYVGQADSDGIL